LHERHGFKLDVDQVRRKQQQIRDDLETHGNNEEIQSYVQVINGDEVDAALQTLPHYGYVDASHPRMVATRARIQAELGSGPLVYRYAEGTDDGLSRGEGAFGICGFWAVECAALGGDISTAEQTFQHLLDYANDLGLFAEEIDPTTGQGLGNFPQAFTHVGLINAALTLEECRDQAIVGQPFSTVREDER
jgi:GH15 family glucan-1,4-alpha-glucosidase